MKEGAMVTRAAVYAASVSLISIGIPLFLATTPARALPDACAYDNCEFMRQFVDDDMPYHTYVCSLVVHADNQIQRAQAAQLIANRWYGGDAFAGNDAFSDEASQCWAAEAAKPNPPPAAAPAYAPYCQVQLGDKIATVPCGTCEDVLAEPGMAGNVACPGPGVPQPPPATASPATADTEQLSPNEQQYINNLKYIGIQPTSTVKKLAQTGPTICQNLMDAYRKNGSPLAGPGLKNAAASAMRRGNPNLSWDGAQRWIQFAVNDFCPDDVTGMRLQ
jgi:hypothetical protein